MSKTMAAIDIGSNTVQLLIATVEGASFISRDNYIRTTRLGATKNNLLTDEAIALTLAATEEFLQLISQAKAERLRIIATSAVRDAANSISLTQALAKITTTPVEILTGTQEAELSFLGAKSGHSLPHSLPVVDVGGSSTELIYQLANGQIKGSSANIGCVRMKNNGWSVEQLYQQAEAAFAGQTKADAIIGVGGTITAIAGILLGLTQFERQAIEGTVITKEQLEQLLEQLLPLSIAQRCAYSPLLAQRGEIIVEGLQIWLSLLEILSAKKIIVSANGILDGAIISML